MPRILGLLGIAVLPLGAALPAGADVPEAPAWVPRLLGAQVTVID